MFSSDQVDTFLLSLKSSKAEIFFGKFSPRIIFHAEEDASRHKSEQDSDGQADAAASQCQEILQDSSRAHLSSIPKASHHTWHGELSRHLARWLSAAAANVRPGKARPVEGGAIRHIRKSHHSTLALWLD